MKKLSKKAKLQLGRETLHRLNQISEEAGEHVAGGHCTAVGTTCVTCTACSNTCTSVSTCLP
jgi:hypothetical protein